MFAVVEFLKSDMESTGEISVVPLMWLHKNQTKCYWPNRTNKIPFQKFVESLTPFKKTWPTYRVKCHFTCATYEQADNNLKNILTDNYESADSNISLCQKSILNESDESLCSRSLSPNILSTPEVSKNIPDVTNSPSTFICEDEGAKRMRLDDDEINIPLSQLSHSSQHNIISDGEMSSRPSSIVSCSSRARSSIIPLAKNTEFENVVLQTLSQISASVSQHSILLAEINRRTSMTGAENLVPPVDLPDFPFTILLNFQEFDLKLRDDQALWTYMVRKLATLGGSGTESHTRRMLKYLLSDEVARNFNWKGREKISFEKLKTKQLILDAVKYAFPSREIDEYKLCNVIKEWLKFASTRLIKGKKSIPTNT
ncbi:unnamed protein product [Phaedon cochleariae]|uniref:DUF4806 domain-containing protein n=1 Tax=Phaedon cochleariae TaxID=80249 RepID=A0A9N9SKB3_PHACE|nr:unnamed protein product [Phaedon cochleariae]CAH1116393.1 unnamed protein product [Phaedon cochleariae]